MKLWLTFAPTIDREIRRELTQILATAVSHKADQVSAIENQLQYRLTRERRTALVEKAEEVRQEMGMAANEAWILSKNEMEEAVMELQEYNGEAGKKEPKEVTRAREGLQQASKNWKEVSRHAIEWQLKEFAEQESELGLTGTEEQMDELEVKRAAIGSGAVLAAFDLMEYINDLAALLDVEGLDLAEEHALLAKWDRTKDALDYICIEAFSYSKQECRDDDVSLFSTPAVMFEGRTLQKTEPELRYIRGLVSEDAYEVQSDAFKGRIARLAITCEEVASLKSTEENSLTMQLVEAQEEQDDQKVAKVKSAVEKVHGEKGDALFLLLRCRRKQLEWLERRARGAGFSEQERLRVERSDAKYELQVLGREVLALKRLQLQSLTTRLNYQMSPGTRQLVKREVLRIREMVGEASRVVAEEKEQEIRYLTKKSKAADVDEARKVKADRHLSKVVNDYGELYLASLSWQLDELKAEASKIEERLLLTDLPDFESKVLKIELNICQARLKELEEEYEYWSTASNDDEQLEATMQMQRERRNRYAKVMRQKERMVSRLLREQGSVEFRKEKEEMLLRAREELERYKKEKEQYQMEKEQLEKEAEAEALELAQKIAETEKELSEIQRKAVAASKVRNEELERAQEDYHLESEALAVLQAMGSSESEIEAMHKYEFKKKVQWREISRLYMLAMQEVADAQEDKNVQLKLQRRRDRQEELDSWGQRQELEKQVEKELQTCLAWEREVEEMQEDRLLQLLVKEHEETIRPKDLDHQKRVAAHEAYKAASERKAEYDKRQTYFDDLAKGMQMYRVPVNPFARARPTMVKLVVQPATNAYIIKWASRNKTDRQASFPLVKQSQIFVDSSHGLFKSKTGAFRGIPKDKTGLAFSVLNPKHSINLCADSQEDFEKWSSILGDILK